jgi:hypothetical protein
MESKNKTVLMSVIDSVLEEIVWVGKQGEAISLKEAIAKNMKKGASAGIESLSRDDLVGAMTSFQIRRQSFSENTKDMRNEDIAKMLKVFIFDETRSQMDRLERELGLEAKARKLA